MLLGHLDDYESYNPQVETFVTSYHGQSNQQIRGDAKWKAAAAAKPKHIEDMTQQEKDAFKSMLDSKLPADPAVVAKVVPRPGLNAATAAGASKAP